jgi:hypothetical protein
MPNTVNAVNVKQYNSVAASFWNSRNVSSTCVCKHSQSITVAVDIGVPTKHFAQAEQTFTKEACCNAKRHIVITGNNEQP